MFFEGSVNGLTVGSPVKLARAWRSATVREGERRLADETRKDILNEGS